MLMSDTDFTFRLQPKPGKSTALSFMQISPLTFKFSTLPNNPKKSANSINEQFCGLFSEFMKVRFNVRFNTRFKLRNVLLACSTGKIYPRPPESIKLEFTQKVWFQKSKSPLIAALSDEYLIYNVLFSEIWIISRVVLISISAIWAIRFIIQ
ncbi:Hypothetical_protein [Hexamita inflata]|uniref:Hypothetical_protein n=1 Tax=Hexamita inflata TaxID=28002 RepID=A0AA86QQP5_9EUKA|nr:Hypothetical protein HINF_LOCUS45024 [Hexamita inflata]